METEQMAEVYGRQPMGSSRPTCRNCGQPYHGGTTCASASSARPDHLRLQVERRANAEVSGSTLPAGALRDFLDAIPEAAHVTIRVVEAGQRDPVVTGYLLSASW